jgi:hypothetical protein
VVGHSETLARRPAGMTRILHSSAWKRRGDNHRPDRSCGEKVPDLR